jgi:hypothetical protein
MRIKVSPKIREAWFNGKVYCGLNDQSLSVVPDLTAHQPDRDRLKWHTEKSVSGVDVSWRDRTLDRF